jgi:hypothetical protein
MRLIEKVEKKKKVMTREDNKLRQINSRQISRKLEKYTRIT